MLVFEILLNNAPLCNWPQKNNIPHFQNQRYIKGIDRPFGGGVESILIRSVFVNWRLGKFFISF
jgi:hypothetical protein